MDKVMVSIRLMAGWNGMILGGMMTEEELYTSLEAQISGVEDLSPDELTDDMAILMGWNPSDITESQYDIWRNLVNQTAKEYMNR